MRNFYSYNNPSGQKLHGYERRYQTHQLRKKGFISRAEAESHLRQAMSDIDAEVRGEVRSKPTTAQDALNIYRRNLDVRAKDKDYQFAHNVKSNCKIVQEFVDRFGPNRLVREVTETDLREFYQLLCFRPTLSKNSAAVHIGRIQGMLKAAQKAKPDLVNWLRPTLTVRRKTKFERRVVEPWEYARLVNTLLSPPLAPSRRVERASLWRDAGDAVQLLRMTGGRLNEVLRMKLDQFSWSKGIVRLNASKTENQRDLPLWDCIYDVVQRRIHEGLTSNYVFPRARVATFDNAIARACRKAARLAKLNYGQANGFTCHSLRHTFITDLMEKTNNDAGTVMKYSGHKTLESFSGYLHSTEQGSILAMQAMKDVALILRSFENVGHIQNVENVAGVDANSLPNKQVAVS
ncbi:MAG: integrase family protein [Acidobacteria bacterium]|nr:integrase family protein [Acidobacteriota bacterium]